MRLLYLTLFFSLLCFVAYSQSFEGEVIYHTTCKSRLTNVSDAQMQVFLGDSLIYYMKGGDYRSDANGKWLKWQIYLNKDNKLYDQLPTSDTIFWEDGSVNKDSILNVKFIKNADIILGHKCDELTFECKSDTVKYLYSTDYQIDSKLYQKQIYQNWYEYLRRANAMPLQMIISNREMFETMTAIAVIERKVPDSVFVLPPNPVIAPLPTDN